MPRHNPHRNEAPNDGSIDSNQPGNATILTMTVDGLLTPEQAKGRSGIAIPRAEWLIFGAALASGLADRLWVLLLGNSAAHFDEVIVGLMANHILEGERPLFFYGQSYLGAPDAYFAALVFKLFGSSTESLRIMGVIYYALFGYLFYRLFRPLLGPRTTLLGLIPLALPFALLRPVIVQPHTSFGLMTVLGFLMLNIAVASGTSWKSGSNRIYGQALLLGVLGGFAAYVLALSLLYFLTAAILLFLPIVRLILREARLKWPAPRVAVLALFAGLALAGWAYTLPFSPGCPGFQSIPDVVRSFFSIAAVAAPVVVLGIASFGIRSWRPILVTGLLGTGLIAGFLPELLFRLQNRSVTTPIERVCPTDVAKAASTFIGQFAGPVFGIAPFTNASTLVTLDAWQTAGLLLVVGAAIILALYQLVRASWAVISGGELTAANQGWLIVGCLFFGNAVAILFTGNGQSVASIRYFLIGWTVIGLILAQLVLQASRRNQLFGISLLAFWLVFAGYRNLTDSMASVNRRAEWYPDATVNEIVAFAGKSNATAGYSELAFSRILTFLSHEQVILLPYNAVPYYQPYVERLKSGGREIWILPFEDEIAVTSRNSADLTGYLKQSGFGNGPIRPDLAQDMAGANVVDRRQIGIYDIWILE